MLRILVTGASGFVGRNLVPELIDKGHYVRCAVTRHVDGLLGEQHLIKRLEEQDDWTDVVKDIDAIIHLAARVHILNDTSQNPYEEYYRVNCEATRLLAEQAVKSGVKRFVFLSSIKVNGEYTETGCPFTEDSHPEPDDAYARSKLEAEKCLLDISKNSPMEIVILRPPLIYGPGVGANFLKMIQLVQKEWPLPFARVKNRRSFIYIDNLVSALCLVMDAPKAAEQLYLVADDECWSLPELLKVLAEKSNKKSRIFSFPIIFISTLFAILGKSNLNTRLFKSLEVTNKKIKEELNWIPPVCSVDGLVKTIRQANNHKK